MKHLKKYKLFETGEWASDVDWQFVKDNPDDESEEAGSIRQMENILRTIEYEIEIESEIDFEITDIIRGYDLHSGPKGIIKINDDSYNFWNSENGFWIEDFSINNMEVYQNPGFEGGVREIVDAIIDQYKPINKALRKYNI